MSYFSLQSAELGRLALDLASQAYTEGREDDADKFVQLAYTIFEEALDRPEHDLPGRSRPPAA